MKILTLAFALAVSLALAAPGLATAPPETVTVEDTFSAVNPCTGKRHRVTATVTLTVHAFELTDPDRHHANVQFKGTFVTSDGFAGQFTGPDIDNGAGLFEDPEGDGIFTSILNVKGTNESGQIISIHLNFHVTLVKGEVVAFVDNFSERCVGAPA